MDEFDKYYADCEFMFQWTKESIQSTFFVTHRDVPMDGLVTGSSLLFCRMRFEAIGRDGPLKRVRIRQEQP